MIDILYNASLFAVVLVVAVTVAQYRHTLVAVAGLGVFGLAGLFLAATMGAGNIFTMMRLVAYALFAQTPLLLLVFALLLWRPRPLAAVLATSAATLVIAIGIDAFIIEPRRLEVTHYQIPAAKLAQKVRIAVVADLQTDVVGDYERQALRRAVEAKPDLLLFAGDYIQAGGNYDELVRELNAILRELDLTVPLGAYAVRGNTERDHWITIFAGTPVECFDATGIRDLGPLALTCLSEADSFATTTQVPATEKFHIVMGHAPNFAMGQIDADLLIAGHTHGGQVQLPFIGPLLTLSAVPRSWASGLTEIADGKRLLVSRGIGHERASAPRLRFLCRPELAIIDLVPGE